MHRSMWFFSLDTYLWYFLSKGYFIIVIYACIVIISLLLLFLEHCLGLPSHIPVYHQNALRLVYDLISIIITIARSVAASLNIFR